MVKRLMLHYEAIKNALKDTPKTVKTLSDELSMDYHYVYNEVQELIALGKIKVVNHGDEKLLLWTEEIPIFEYQLSHNVLKIAKKYFQFITFPSKVGQMKLPKGHIRHLEERLGNKIQYPFELIVQINAIRVNNQWVKIETE